MSWTNIEWCDAVWNVLRGCSRISQGCMRCYAEQIAARFSGLGQPFEDFAVPYDARRGLRRGGWTGKIALIEDKLEEPFSWRKPRKVFVNSMSDFGHEDLADSDRDLMLAVMLLCPQHTFQVLTKRAANLRRYLSDPALYERVLRAADRFRAKRPELTRPSKFPARWIWWGVSVENQETANERIPELLATPAAVRFISAEPLLGRVNLAKWLYDPCNCFVPALEGAGQHHPLCSTFSQPWGIDWVIVGGESGRDARVCDLSWIRQIVGQCGAAGVACFVKQLGAQPTDGSDSNLVKLKNRKGGDMIEFPADLCMRAFPEVR